MVWEMGEVNPIRGGVMFLRPNTYVHDERKIHNLSQHLKSVGRHFLAISKDVSLSVPDPICFTTPGSSGKSHDVMAGTKKSGRVGIMLRNLCAPNLQKIALKLSLGCTDMVHYGWMYNVRPVFTGMWYYHAVAAAILDVQVSWKPTMDNLHWVCTKIAHNFLLVPVDPLTSREVFTIIFRAKWRPCILKEGFCIPRFRHGNYITPVNTLNAFRLIFSPDLCKLN